MKLTSFTDYSLRVLLFLAADPGRRVTVAEVAQAFSISENHLTKVVHLLGRQGWIETVRGKGGGMRLGRDPKDIVIGAVLVTAAYLVFTQLLSLSLPAGFSGDGLPMNPTGNFCAPSTTSTRSS